MLISLAKMYLRILCNFDRNLLNFLGDLANHVSIKNIIKLIFQKENQTCHHKHRIGLKSQTMKVDAWEFCINENFVNEFFSEN